MPLLGGFKIVSVGWLGRSSIWVDVDSTYSDKHLQLYANRKLIGYSVFPGSGRVNGQVWDAHVSSAPINVMLVEPSEAYIDFGDILEVDPWNRYFLTWTVPHGYAPDCHHFDVLGASNYDEAVDHLLFQVRYTGPTVYSIYLPAIPTLPMPVPSLAGARSRWQDWSYKVIPRDDAIPSGNAGTPTDITIPALIYPADLVYRSDGSRFSAVQAGATLSLGYTVPA